MAVAVVKTFGADYEQILLIGDPLFMKRLTDHAAEQALDWRRYRMHAVIGEETFGEQFRSYIGRCLGARARSPRRRPHHVLVRRRRARPASLLRDGGNPRTRPGRDGHAGARARPAGRAGARHPGWRPMLLAFDPQRTFIEIMDPDERRLRRDGDLDAGSGPPGAAAPLSDRRRRPSPRSRRRWRDALREHGVAVDGLPASLLALRGRAQRGAAERVAGGALQGRAVREPGPGRHASPARRG